MHAKTFERSREFDEFFLVGDDGRWTPSGGLGTPTGTTTAGQTSFTFNFSDPATRDMFVVVAEWLKAQPKSPTDGFPPPAAFTVGIWKATGVEAPK